MSALRLLLTLAHNDSWVNKNAVPIQREALSTEWQTRKEKDDDSKVEEVLQAVWRSL